MQLHIIKIVFHLLHPLGYNNKYKFFFYTLKGIFLVFLIIFVPQRV